MRLSEISECLVCKHNLGMTRKGPFEPGDSYPVNVDCREYRSIPLSDGPTAQCARYDFLFKVKDEDRTD